MLIQALLRRLSTRRGTLAFHPDYGLDLRDYLLDSVTEDTAHRIRSDVIQECEEDERVESADASVEWDAATETLSIDVTVEAAAGPFDFVVEVSKLAITLAQSEEG
jgi:phage baseplate assembly protein W